MKTHKSSGDYLFREEETDKIYNIFISSVKEDEKDLCLILGIRDLRKEIFPILRYVAFPSYSYESFLSKKENDSILYLSDLKFKPYTAMKFRLPLTLKNLPAAIALQGRLGLIEAIDYRGEKVVAFASKIEKPEWILISKIDNREFLSTANTLFSLLYVTIIMIIFILLSLVILLQSFKAKYSYQKLYEVESMLRSSIERFKITIDSLSEGVIITDVDGKIDYLNKTAENLTGWTFREAKGRPLEEVYKIKGEITNEWVINPAQKILQNGIVQDLANHTILVSASGIECAIADTGAAIRNEKGEIIGTVVVFRDETERRTLEKALQESSKKLKNLLDNMIEGCQIINYDWRYMYLNKEAQRQLRKTKKELLGEQIWKCYPGIEKTDLFARMFKSMKERTIEIFEYEFTYSDESKGYFIMSIQPVDEGILILSKDISELKKAELILKEKEKRFVEITKNLAETLFLINPNDHTINFVSDSIKNFCTYDAGEIISSRKKFYELMNVENPEEFKDQYFIGIESGENFTIDTVVVRVNSEQIYVRQRFTLLRDSEGKLINIICLAYDYTKEKELEKQLIEREHLLSGIYDSVREIIAVIDPWTKKILFVNNFIEHLLGYKVDEVIGKTTQFLHSTDKGFLEFKESLKESLLQGKNNFEGEIQLKKKNGELIWAEFNITFIIENGNCKYGIALLRDITEKKKMIYELVKAKEIAEEANRIKDGFISAMSHEIRTPLNVIIGFTNLLREILYEKLREDEKSYFDGILRGADRLVRTGTLILNCARLDAKDFDIEIKELPLNPILENVVNKYRKDAEEKRIDLIVSLSRESIMIMGDEYAINIILENIIDNAIKFSKKGKVEIRTEVYENKASVIIKDEGVGINKEYLKHLSQKFSQEEVGTRRQFEGLGLGLYTVKKLISLCGGDIKIESEKELGTTVYMDFKLAS